MLEYRWTSLGDMVKGTLHDYDLKGKEKKERKGGIQTHDLKSGWTVLYPLCHNSCPFHSYLDETQKMFKWSSKLRPSLAGYLPNGWLEGSRTTLHAVVTFRCIEGMTFEGQSFRTTCQVSVVKKIPSSRTVQASGHSKVELVQLPSHAKHISSNWTMTESRIDESS